MKKLTKSFYLNDTLTVAESLVGCYLVRNTDKGMIVGRINETEAYIGGIDKACHAYNGKRTQRTEPLFQDGGIAYIYLIYGMYYCLNFVAEPKHVPCAVLIRGCDIVEGLDLASLNRYGKEAGELTKNQLKNISNGPGKLCRAFDIDKNLNYEDLTNNNLFVCEEILSHLKEVKTIEKTKRINIDYAEEAVDFLWRFTG